MQPDNRDMPVKPAEVANSLRSYLSRSKAELPASRDIQKSADEVLQMHNANGGATFSLYFGSQAGQHLYSASVFPDRSYVVEGRLISREEIESFLQTNVQLLTDPRCCIGTWYSEETNLTYIDVSTILPNKREVISLARRYNQEGVFDLFRMEYLPTGGTGEPVDNMPPVEVRLSPLRRGRRKDHDRKHGEDARSDRRPDE